MKVHFLIFVTSIHHVSTEENTNTLIKTFESNIRPVSGDIIDDPGFDSRFHNGYEVAKVTINYTSNECFVSIASLVTEIENMPAYEYMEKLKNNGWQVRNSKEQI